MSTANPNLTNEIEVERAVRSILQPLHRQLEAGNQWGCALSAYVLAPLVFLGLWWFGWTWWLALPIAVATPLPLWVAYWVWYDRRMAARAAAVFERQFPPGHPNRDLAVRMLSEMQYPTRAHEKLRVALGNPPAR